MCHVTLEKDFGIDNLTLHTGPEPKPDDDEVLVRMKAASLNYVDLAVVRGILDPSVKLPFVPVADGAGAVEEVGRNVREFKPGDRVATFYIPPWHGGRYRREYMGMAIRPGAGVTPGQLSEYRTFRSHELIRVPDSLSFAEASTLPTAGVTAWNALAYGHIKAGDTVLLHGTGGVSIFALQFAKMFGASATITSSEDKKLTRAISLGADCTINYWTCSDLSQEVMRITDGRGAERGCRYCWRQQTGESLSHSDRKGTFRLSVFWGHGCRHTRDSIDVEPARRSRG